MIYLLSLIRCLQFIIKEKRTELIEQTFNREGSLYLAFNENHAFLILNNIDNIRCGHVRKCVMLSITFWTTHLYDLA